MDRGISQWIFRAWRSCPPELVFSPYLLKYSGRDEDLGTTTCPNTVVWVRKGMHPVGYFRSKT